jgi:hypothetical protein
MVLSDHHAEKTALGYINLDLDNATGGIYIKPSYSFTNYINS